ncbi:MAG: metalloregulator ArsR/SmtB family transcription factor [Alphaproteobacteria bacterium]|nr:metalloregulator ArsR/SmtB family transcription factor [Alphaproteobacteria bacterium]
MTQTLEDLLEGLRAAAEPTRLRLLALCAQGELTVSELVQILGQSQPRVSRHLKLLCDAGLLDRQPEGSWVFYRLAEGSRANGLVRRLADMLPAEDAQLRRDRDGLVAVRRARAEHAAAYFEANAKGWDRIRSLHVRDAEVERELAALVPAGEGKEILDIGTGTGRILEVLGTRGARGIGVDLSPAMLRVARANLARAGLANIHVRQGDMYRLPWQEPAFDAVTVHQVLHFADDPALAIAEAARVLKPGGRIVIADFAPHELDTLRTDHAHRRLGFADGEVQGWLRAAGLKPAQTVSLPGEKLTVCLWAADKPPTRQTAH